MQIITIKSRNELSKQDIMNYIFSQTIFVESVTPFARKKRTSSWEKEITFKPFTMHLKRINTDEYKYSNIITYWPFNPLLRTLQKNPLCKFQRLNIYNLQIPFLNTKTLQYFKDHLKLNHFEHKALQKIWLGMVFQTHNNTHILWIWELGKTTSFSYMAVTFTIFSLF